jgi:small subunit ribosomal protein S16
MPVRLRLQRHGRRKRPFYHIVAADARAPRDGKFIEKLGTYNPMTVPATIELDRMAAYKWIMKGAQPSDTVRAILRFKGVMYFKHLMRGVQKGALTQEDASKKFEEWIEAKEGSVAARREVETQKTAKFHKDLSGKVPEIKVPEPEPVVEAAAAAVEGEAEAPAEPSATSELDAAMAEAKAATDATPEAPAE